YHRPRRGRADGRVSVRVSRPSRRRMPGVPGVPDGGVTGAVGVTLGGSRGSCACAVELAASSSPRATNMHTELTRRRDVKCAELVVCVSLTDVRTVYFT